MPFANNANANFLSSIIFDIQTGRITNSAACDAISGTACDMIDCAGNERNLAPRLLTKAEADGDTETLVCLRLLGIARRFRTNIADDYDLSWLVQDLQSDRIDGGQFLHVIARSSRIAIVAAQRFSRREEPTAAHRLAIGNGNDNGESETRLVVATAVAAGNTRLLVLAANLGVVVQDGDRFTYREHDVTGQTADWRAQVDRIQRRARAIGNPYVFADAHHASGVAYALDLRAIFADLGNGNLGSQPATNIISDSARRMVATILRSNEDDAIRILLTKAAAAPTDETNSKFLLSASILGISGLGNNSACQALVNDAQYGRVRKMEFRRAISTASNTVQMYARKHANEKAATSLKNRRAKRSQMLCYGIAFLSIYSAAIAFLVYVFLTR